MKPELCIIGGGTGVAELMTAQAYAAVKSAKRVLAPPRIADSLAGIGTDILPCSLGQIHSALEDIVDTAIIVSGDSGFYSLASLICAEYRDKYDITVLPGISSMQYLMSRIKKPYQNVRAVSLHGRNGSAVPYVCYNSQAFFLTGGENSASAVIKSLVKAGLGDVSVTIGERLSYPDEHILTGTAQELCSVESDELAVLYVENPSAVNPSIRLRDFDFERGKVPMTKEHIRTLSIARMNIQPGDTVYDIGAGSGSVAVAACYKAVEGRVYAVEHKPDAASLIALNRKKLGAYNMEIITASAPDGLKALPPPDKVFIGGSGGKMHGVFEALLKNEKPFTICINAITLESINEAVELLKKFDFSDIEISCINCSNADTVGSYHMMRGENPVYIISAERSAKV